MAKLVSKTYGDALFALAVEEHMVDQLYEEAQAVAQILRENTELTRLMNHPKIEKEEKVRLIEDIFKGRIGDELVGLLRMLVQKGHYKETDQVFTYFIDRVKEYKKIGTAYVTSAMELTPQQKQAVEQKLLQRVPPAYRVDAHHWLILLGRYVCQARKPRCWECNVVTYCKYTPKTPAP